MDGSEVLVILKGREVDGWPEDVAVDWAGIELRGRAEGLSYCSHEGGWDGPVVAKVEGSSLGIYGGCSRVVSLKEGRQG